MQTITLETEIAAPIRRCFLLSLSMDLHKASAAQTHEEAIDGVMTGIIGHNQTVTWRARHFGFMLTHKTLISKYDHPAYFQDIMLEGMFKTFIHDHYFLQMPGGKTRMRDELRFSAPLGPFGLLAETFVLRSYLRRFLQVRNQLIKSVAESRDDWKIFLPGEELA